MKRRPLKLQGRIGEAQDIRAENAVRLLVGVRRGSLLFRVFFDHHVMKLF